MTPHQLSMLTTQCGQLFYRATSAVDSLQRQSCKEGRLAHLLAFVFTKAPSGLQVWNKTLSEILSLKYSYLIHLVLVCVFPTLAVFLFVCLCDCLSCHKNFQWKSGALPYFVLVATVSFCFTHPMTFSKSGDIFSTCAFSSTPCVVILCCRHQPFIYVVP